MGAQAFVASPDRGVPAFILHVLHTAFHPIVPVLPAGPSTRVVIPSVHERHQPPDAPRELVWKAWTEPDRIKLWWGPAGWSAPSIDIDLRVGGKYLYAMRAPDGLEMWTTGVFREIEPMKRIVYTDSFADEHGNVINPTEAGASADFPLELLDIVTFEQIGGHTKVTMCANGMPASEAELARQGTEQMLEKLAAAVARSAAPAPSPDATVFTLEPGKAEIVISRFLHAPRERVFEILTDPALVPKWWGPGWLTTRVVSMEVRPGGVWDFIQHDVEGNVWCTGPGGIFVHDPAGKVLFAERIRRTLAGEQIEDRQVSLCRYLEEIYHRALEDGGGLSEDVMSRLDDAYLALLAGTSRKR